MSVVWISGWRTDSICSIVRNDARRPEIGQKEQSSSVHHQPVRCPLARNDARRPDVFSVCPSSTRERRSTARRIQSKRTEFVCPSSTSPLSAGSERRSTARQISKKEQNSSVRRQPVRCPLAWNDARRPEFGQKEQSSSVHHQPVRCPLARNNARRPDRSVKHSNIVSALCVKVKDQFCDFVRT